MMNRQDDWEFQYPSSIVNRKFTGGGDPRPYWGDAQKLLYQLKNMMRINEITQQRVLRYFDNGVTIVAKSSFGQDFIEINVPAGGGLPWCHVTFLNVPELVAPMRYPGVIGRGQVGGTIGYSDNYHFPVEIEGTDFIKTYYTIGRVNCETCKEEWLEGCTQEVCANGIRNEKEELIVQPGCNTQFIYEVLPNDPIIAHVEQRCEGIGLRPADLTNHSIESIFACGGDIIEYGKDEKGRFILWKVYSEYACFAPALFQTTGLQSRTGYGIFRLKLALKNSTNREICEAHSYVTVDCCQKDAEFRVPQLWWDYEECIGSSPFMEWGGAIICQAPSLVDPWALWRQATQLFYCIPEITGACLPYTWDLTGSKGGIGNMCTGGDYTRHHVDDGIAVWYVANIEDTFGSPSCEPVVLTVTDRCGNSDKVEMDCCKASAEQEIALGYTSLLMGCSDIQDLVVTYGCPPYTWSTSSGSLLMLDHPFNYRARLTTASSNANCANNPTVTVTDCCGKIASVKFAVNCYTGGTAIEQCVETISDGTCYDCYGTDHCVLAHFPIHSEHKTWDCAGNIATSCVHDEIAQFGVSCTIYPDCNNPPVTPVSASCCAAHACNYGLYCGECSTGGGVCGTYDVRTVDMKAAGCCPINPFTGLPYD